MCERGKSVDDVWRRYIQKFCQELKERFLRKKPMCDFCKLHDHFEHRIVLPFSGTSSNRFGTQPNGTPVPRVRWWLRGDCCPGSGSGSGSCGRAGRVRRWRVRRRRRPAWSCQCTVQHADQHVLPTKCARQLQRTRPRTVLRPVQVRPALFSR